MRSLFASSHDVVAVVTQPDRPRGRGRKPAPSPVKTLALAHDCAVLQPASLRRDAGVAEQLASLRPAAIVVVAYGNILPPSVLEIPRHGCLNVHASLLPKYRGAAPINWALMQGETVTGCTVIQMDEHVDTGDVWWHAACDVAADDDALSLGARLADLGAAGLLEVLAAIEQGTRAPRPQPDDGVSYAPKLTKELGPVDWQTIGYGHAQPCSRSRSVAGRHGPFGRRRRQAVAHGRPRPIPCGGAGHGDRGDAGGAAGSPAAPVNCSSMSYSRPTGAAWRRPTLHRATACSRGNGLPESMSRADRHGRRPCACCTPSMRSRRTRTWRCGRRWTAAPWSGATGRS